MANPDPHHEARVVPVRIQHTSMESFDPKAQHEHDAKAVFDRAVEKKIWACTGTEAGGGKANHDLRDALIKQARAHDFYIFAHPMGEWVACNKAYLKDFTHGFAGPYIPGHGGKGKHLARGITWVQGTAKDGTTGRLAFGSVHYLTDKAEGRDDLTNAPLIKGIAEWGRQMGKGRNVAFICGDTNTNDRQEDVFNGRPFTTAADELKRWQNTGHGPIDVIASYNFDGRVKAKSFDVLDDSEFKLYSDHFLIQAVYEVGEVRPKK